MRMDEMNKYFESKGFKVERKYISCDTDCTKGYYNFIISKGNDHQSGVYRWPNDQQAFMDKMIKKFEKDFPEEPRICDFDSLRRYANERCCGFEIVRSPYGQTEVTVECGSDSITHEFYSSISEVIPQVKMMIDKLTKPDSHDDFVEYCRNDVKMTEEIYKMWTKTNIRIKNVIFNDPATIVFWTDGTKTVVKAQGDDIFDPEKGLAMAISKKALGNKGNYCNELKKWLPKKYLCMYCGAETTNPEWDHMCDECRNEPVDPIPENLKKKVYCDIKLPDLTGLKAAANAMQNLGITIREMNRKNAVQKAYDILVGWRDGKVPVCKEIKENMCEIDELIGYLGEALEG